MWRIQTVCSSFMHVLAIFIMVLKNVIVVKLFINFKMNFLLILT